MNSTIELPENAKLANRVVVGIGRANDVPTSPRVVYVYWHHSKLPERTDFVHDAATGHISFMAERVIDALAEANPEMTILGSSSLDFPDDE